MSRALRVLGLASLMASSGVPLAAKTNEVVIPALRRDLGRNVALLFSVYESYNSRPPVQAGKNDFGAGRLARLDVLNISRRNKSGLPGPESVH